MILNVPSMDLLTLQAEDRDRPRILGCLSMSGRAMGIAAEAWRLARRLDAKLHLLHVGPYTPSGRRRLHRMLSAASVPMDDVDLRVIPGVPEEQIAHAAEQLDASVIVAGTQEGESTLEQLAESIAGRIVQVAPSPVLLISQPEVAERPINTFVAAVDFDDPSRRMLGGTIDWMRAEGATNLFVVHELAAHQRIRRGLRGPNGSAQADFLQDRTADIRRMLADYDTTGLHVHIACMRSRSHCDPLWYATAVWADVLCLPLTDQRLHQWAKLIRHRVGFKVCRTTCRILLHRDGM